MEFDMTQSEFASFCRALSRNKSTWNGKTMDEILSCSYAVRPVNYGQLLGKALLRNSHVTKLAVHMEHGYIDAPGSVVNAANISSLLQYFATSTCLREVRLIGRWGTTCEIYRRLCMRTLASNPHITALNVDDEEMFPSKELASFLNTTKSLRKLEIPLMDNNVVVREALATNQTLHELVLLENSLDKSIMGGDLLSMLISHPTVRVLEYDHFVTRRGGSIWGPQFPEELKTLLQTSQTLRELRLSTFFDGPHMELLIDGLRECKLEHMQFLVCAFTEDATELLTTYLQNSGGSTEIKFLSYELCIVEEVDTFESFQICTGEVMTTLLTGSCGVPALDLRGLNDSAICSLWNGLGAKANEIRLPSLKMDHSDWSMDDDVATCMYDAIPRLVHMRDLTMVVPQTKSEAYKFQLAIWKNGSLHHVNEYSKHKRMDLYFVKMAFQRNQSLNKLLLNTTWTTTMSHHKDGDDYDAATTNTAATCDSSSSILPLLFSVAQQAPRHAPNWIFMGLLGYNNYDSAEHGRMGRQPLDLNNNDSTTTIHPCTGVRKRSGRLHELPRKNKTARCR